MKVDILSRLKAGGRYHQFCSEWGLPIEESPSVNLLEILRLWRDMRGLLLADGDGTTISMRGYIHEYIFEALSSLREHGHKTGLLTGKTRRQRGYSEGHYTYCAYCNGAFITKDGVPIMAKFITNVAQLLDKLGAIVRPSEFQIVKEVFAGEEVVFEIKFPARHNYPLDKIEHILADEPVYICQASWVHICPTNKRETREEIAEHSKANPAAPCIYMGNDYSDICILDDTGVVGIVPLNSPSQVQKHAAFICPEAAPNFSKNLLQLLNSIVIGGQ